MLAASAVGLSCRCRDATRGKLPLGTYSLLHCSIPLCFCRWSHPWRIGLAHNAGCVVGMVVVLSVVEKRGGATTKYFQVLLERGAKTPSNYPKGRNGWHEKLRVGIKLRRKPLAIAVACDSRCPHQEPPAGYHNHPPAHLTSDLSSTPDSHHRGDTKDLCFINSILRSSRRGAEGAVVHRSGQTAPPGGREDSGRGSGFNSDYRRLPTTTDDLRGPRCHDDDSWTRQTKEDTGVGGR